MVSLLFVWDHAFRIAACDMNFGTLRLHVTNKVACSRVHLWESVKPGEHGVTPCENCSKQASRPKSVPEVK